MTTLAVPNKGRLHEPSVRLLRDAGLEFEVTERALSVTADNVDLELMFVRADDIPELVCDGIADAGITGIDLLEEHGDGLPRLVELGYGRCRLAAAVPNMSTIRSVPDLAGSRVATAHPRATTAFFDRAGIDALIVPLRGSVEVAPKIGVAEAIVDLVSTGSTLRVNGLREVGTVLESQAVLVAAPSAADTREVRQIATALRAVVEGRTKRYLLLNAPADATERIAALIPGLEAPTVIPLAEEGWVAIHSVVAAAELWALLPRLEEAGGRGILVSPIERLVP